MSVSRAVRLRECPLGKSWLSAFPLQHDKQMRRQMLWENSEKKAYREQFSIPINASSQNADPKSIH